MSARRCSSCNINFPLFDRYEVCPACGEETWFDRSEDSDIGWQEAAQERHDELERARKRAGQSATTLAELYPHPAEARVTIHTRDEHEFVVHRDLIEEGYSTLEDFSVVFINGVFYELQGHGPGYRLIGEYHPDGVWWIEKVPLTFASFDIPTEDRT